MTGRKDCRGRVLSCNGVAHLRAPCSGSDLRFQAWSTTISRNGSRGLLTSARAQRKLLSLRAAKNDSVTEAQSNAAPAVRFFTAGRNVGFPSTGRPPLRTLALGIEARFGPIFVALFLTMRTVSTLENGSISITIFPVTVLGALRRPSNSKCTKPAASSLSSVLVKFDGARFVSVASSATDEGLCVRIEAINDRFSGVRSRAIMSAECVLCSAACKGALRSPRATAIISVRNDEKLWTRGVLIDVLLLLCMDATSAVSYSVALISNPRLAINFSTAPKKSSRRVAASVKTYGRPLSAMSRCQ